MKLYSIKRKVYLMLLVILIFTSCTKKSVYENAEEFTYDDFKTSKELKSKEVTLDSMVMKPRDLFLMDSLLLIMDRGREKFIYVYDLKSKKQIACQINMGQGPDDMLYSKILDCTDTTISILDILTHNLFVYNKAEFISAEAARPMKRIKLKSPLYVDMELVNGKLFGSSWTKEHQVKLLDLNKDTEESIIPFPITDVIFSENERIEAFYKHLTSNKKNKLVNAYYMTDLLEFYDLEGNLIKRLHGPDQFINKFKEFNDGKIMGARPIRGESREAYLDPKFSDGKFYFLYSGDLLGYKENPTKYNKLFVFSEEGNPLTFYKLDTPILSFVVDGKNKKIYGIAEDPEYKIVEFDL